MRIRIITVLAMLMLLTGLIAQQISDLRDISMSEKLYYLSMIWKEIDYNYPFFNELEGFDLDKTYREHLEMTLESTSLYEYYRILQRFTASLQDCNTRIVLPQAISSHLSYPLVMLQDMDDKVIIVNVGKSNVERIPIGSELLEIANRPVNTYLAAEVAPYISASNKKVWRDKVLLLAFLGIEGSEVGIKIRKPDGTIASVQLRRSWQNDSWAEFIWQKEVILHYKLDDGIIYLEMNRFNDDLIFRMFENMLKELRESRGIIIDLRENFTGSINLAYDMLKHFTRKEKLPFPIINSRKHIPMYRAFGTPAPWYGYQANRDYLDYGERNVWIAEDPIFFDNDPSKEKLDVPLVLLTGPKTASPAEEFALVLREYRDDVRIVGTNSSGRRGQGLILSLPLMGQVWISTSKDTYPDGRVLSRKGVQPDIEISQTYSDYLNEKDTVKERAIRLIKEMTAK